MTASRHTHGSRRHENLGSGKPEHGGNAPTVYIVDDDESVRRAIGLLVRSRGWTVAAYASAEEFLDRFVRDHPACLILDLHMPGMSGPDLQSALRRRDPNLPVIVVTAFPEHPLTERARELGAVAVLAKPFRGCELGDRVQACLEADTLPAA